MGSYRALIAPGRWLTEEHLASSGETQLEVRPEEVEIRGRGPRIDEAGLTALLEGAIADWGDKPRAESDVSLSIQVRSFLDLSRRAAAEPLVQGQHLRDLLLDGVQRVQRGHRLLEDEADVVAAHPAQIGRAGIQHLGATVVDRARDFGRRVGDLYRAGRMDMAAVHPAHGGAGGCGEEDHRGSSVVDR